MTPARTILAASVAVALVPAAALAQDPGGGHVVGGHLTKRDARAFIKRQLPGEAPALLLKDERAGFFSTQTLHVQAARRCDRRSTSEVSCRYRVRLRPDAPHRKRNWWPIRCAGSVLVAHLRGGALGGDLGDYVCRTVQPH